MSDEPSPDLDLDAILQGMSASPPPPRGRRGASEPRNDQIPKKRIGG